MMTFQEAAAYLLNVGIVTLILVSLPLIPTAHILLALFLIRTR